MSWTQNSEMIFIYIAYILSGIAAIQLYARYKDIPVSLKYFAHLLVGHIVFQSIANVLYAKGINNFIYYKAVLLIFYTLTYQVLLEIVEGSFYKKWLKIIFIIGLLVIAGQYSTSFYTTYGEGFTNAVLVENLAIVLGSLLIFYQRLKTVSQVELKRQWQFFLVTAFFFYSLVSSAFWGITKILIHLNMSNVDVMGINKVVYLIETVLFFWAVQVFISEQKKLTIGTN